MEFETDIRSWLEDATRFHKLQDGDLIIVKVEEPSYQWQRALWDMFKKALRHVNEATGKNPTVLFLTPGWDVETVPRARVREVLLDLLRKQDEAIETCRSCKERYPRRDGKCPVCGLKVANLSSREASDG